MAQIELTQEEMHMLRDTLKTYLSELTFEIAFTHAKDSAEVLRRRAEFLERFIERLDKELASGG
jgi:RNAse (barnase) inhibitor barstar